ncbi:hypothetical protein VZT92_022563 [Zoarces viviparus]|uniref:Reverse transcriptase domain-containing protein n=1 Tax=Zoarces viviparus TaxID=48416 RepID=A0AAW1EBQ8_ZOAVI
MIFLITATSSTLTLNTGVPQGRVLGPPLYSQFTRDFVATHREEVRAPTSWCQDSVFHLNVSKTKELIMDDRKTQGERHAPFFFSGTTVERVSSFRFLWVQNHGQGSQVGIALF